MPTSRASKAELRERKICTMQAEPKREATTEKVAKNFGKVYPLTKAGNTTELNDALRVFVTSPVRRFLLSFADVEIAADRV